MSCKSQWHSLQSTFRQDVGSFPIGGGVGGARNDGGDGASVGGASVGGAADGGNVGSVGGASGSGGGEAGSTHGGIGGGATDGGDASSVDGEAESGDGEGGGGSLDGGVAGGDGGERRILPSGSESRNSSTSIRRFLVLLAVGGAMSVGEGGDGARLIGDAGPPARAAATGLVGWPLSTAVAAPSHLGRC
jgi:hypothetical protein